VPPLQTTRLILALGVTQVIGYGTLYYAFGVVAAALSADLKIAEPTAFAAFSAALFAGGLVAPRIGRAIDRFGARMVMAAGSVGAALALACLSQAGSLAALAGALVLCEVVAAAVLYDAAFAALAQGAGPARARRAITLMTLIGGFASTVFWPLTHALAEALGWRETFLVFAALHLVVCVPLHLTLPRPVMGTHAAAALAPAFPPLPPERHATAMVWLALGFSLAGVVLSAVAAQWVPVLMALGLDREAAVAAGVVMGPAQVAVRVIDLWVGTRQHPLSTAVLSAGLLALAFLLLALLPAGLAAAAAFAFCFGLAGGLSSIVRGTVPLALFGPQGFGARLGRLASLRLMTGAAAPFLLSLALAGFGAQATVVLTAGLSLAALGALMRVPR
jgi:predicted MFS family arabinose efflux permease